MNNNEYGCYDIIFFDSPFIQLERFCAKIATEIRKLDENIKMAAVVLVQAPKTTPIRMEDCPEGLKKKFDNLFLYDDIANIDYFLINTKPKLLFFGANRIPDLEIVLHAKKLGIKTCAFQHGLYYKGCCINEFNVHNSFLALRTSDKVFNYLRILRRMSTYDKTLYLKVLSRLFLRKGELQSLAMHSFSEPLTCDYAFVIGKEWEDYYHDVFKYNREKIVLMGAHDLDDFDEKIEPRPAICYIANTLVEEGTIRKKEFLEFIDILAASLDKNIPLYIKLHPMSDRTLYTALERENVYFLDKQGELPSTNVYIAHHSTLIGKAVYYSDQLILWQFPSEKNCFYKDYSFAVCRNVEELQDALGSVDYYHTTHEKKEKISRMYYKNPEGAYVFCAKFLVDDIKSNKN